MPDNESKFNDIKYKIFVGIKLLGLGLLLTTCVFALVYSGFSTHPHVKPKYVLFPDAQTLWFYNLILGAIGGILVDMENTWAAMLAGIVTSVTMTSVTLVYVSWRESVLNIEMLIPIAFGTVAGVAAYQFFMDKFYKKKN